MPRRTVIFTALAVGLSLAVGLGLVEVALRLAGPDYYRFNNRSHEYFSNPRGYFTPLRIEDSQQIYGLDYNTTREGYREGGESGRGRAQLLGLGDSFTYGRGVRVEDTYLARLQEMLNRDEVPIVVKNAGRVGADAREVYDQYLLEAEVGRSAIVVYGFVLNDFRAANATRVVGSDYIDINNGGYRYDPWRHYSAIYNYLAFVRERRRLETDTLANYLAAFEGPGADEQFALLEALHKSVTADGGRLVILLFPLLYEFDRYPFAGIHQKIASFAGRHHIDLLDLFATYSRFDASDLWAHPTDHHPNDVAHRLAADELYAFLKNRDLLMATTSETANRHP